MMHRGRNARSQRALGGPVLHLACPALGIVLVGCGATPTTAVRQPMVHREPAPQVHTASPHRAESSRPAWPLPAARVAAGERASTPTLVEGDYEYDMAMSTPIVPSFATDHTSWLFEVLTAISARANHIVRAAGIYRHEATTDAERVAAYTRVGDLLDTLGEAIQTVGTVDGELEVGLEHAATRAYCQALWEYAAALAIDSTAARPSEQRALYGADFEAQCLALSEAGEI